MAKVSIFIRTYKRDVAWLDFCLQSIHQNLHGWDEIVVAVPEGQESHLRYLGDERRVSTSYFREDYLGQQVAKLQAHRHVESDYVFLVDSDVVFLPGAHVSDYFDGGRPRILTKAWPASFSAHPPPAARDVSLTRKLAIERLLGAQMPFSFMQGHGARLFRRSTFAALEQRLPHIEEHTRGITRKEFSEFELLGLFTFLTEQEQYSFVDADRVAAGTYHTRQFWTVDGITKDAEEELAALGFKRRWPSTLSPVDRAKAWLSQTTRAVKRRLKGS